MWNDSDGDAIGTVRSAGVRSNLVSPLGLSGMSCGMDRSFFLRAAVGGNCSRQFASTVTATTLPLIIVGMATPNAGDGPLVDLRI